MKKLLGGQMNIGAILGGVTFVIGVIFGAGTLVQEVRGEKTRIDKHEDLIEKINDNETKLITLIGRHDERIKNLENSKNIK